MVEYGHVYLLSNTNLPRSEHVARSFPKIDSKFLILPGIFLDVSMKALLVKRN